MGSEGEVYCIGENAGSLYIGGAGGTSGMHRGHNGGIVTAACPLPNAGGRAGERCKVKK